ncbi:FliH/SctL family protein [Ferrigenium sp. UT5]|uniref:FliH/SctL family protein n=1 Tax=Ferrigenium sp. UT5 TaxID=3242105 RepID=UPI0035503D65
MSDAEAPDQRTAWQRWELPAFTTTRERIELPTALELEQLQQQAQEEGRQAGYAEGRQRGYADGLQQAAEATQRLQELSRVLQQQVDEQVVQELTGLALDIAHQVIQQSLRIQPELLLAMVREAIASLPVFNQAAHLILNPQDAQLVRAQMGEQLAHSGWKILEDARMERGNARLENANSEVDASLAARWQRVAAAMGQDAPWLLREATEANDVAAT